MDSVAAESELFSVQIVGVKFSKNIMHIPEKYTKGRFSPKKPSTLFPK